MPSYQICSCWLSWYPQLAVTQQYDAMKSNTPFRTNGAYDGTKQSNVPSCLNMRRDQFNGLGGAAERKRGRRIPSTSTGTRNATTPVRAASSSAGSWGLGELVQGDDKGTVVRVRPTKPSHGAPETGLRCFRASGTMISHLRDRKSVV